MMQTPRLALWPESKSHPLIRYVKKGWTINRTFKMTNIVNLMYSYRSLLLLQLVNLQSFIVTTMFKRRLKCETSLNHKCPDGCFLVLWLPVAGVTGASMVTSGERRSSCSRAWSRPIRKLCRLT